jgi:lysophospholipase L1-like esterase
MKTLFGFLFFISVNLFSQSKDSMHIYTYLALGDSYTIGELVPLTKSFPYQVVQQLRNKDYNFHAPEIIARTGWTSDELQDAISRYKLLPKYDYVTLLVGVNNQYRGRDVIEYKEQFEELLKKSIELTGKKDHVIVISIPDYSATPYAASMDKEKITKEIDVFNGVNKALSIQYKVQYLDITADSREVASRPELVTSDGLHPSEKEYKKWAGRIVDSIIAMLK